MTTKVENYTIFRTDGSKVRIATRVIFADGFKVDFLDKLSKREAIALICGILLTAWILMVLIFRG